MSLTTQIERSHQLACSASTDQQSHMIIKQEKGLADLGERLGEKLRSRPRVSYLHSVDVEHPVQVDRKANPKWRSDQLCWEPKGKCFQDYKDMQAELLRALNQSRQESFCEVDVSLFMVGKTPEKAKPVIIISSEDKRSREAAKEAIITSGILTNAKFEIGVLKYLPSGPIHPVASSPRGWSLSTALSSPSGGCKKRTSDDSKDATSSSPDQPGEPDYILMAQYDRRHQMRTTGMRIFVDTFSLDGSRMATANVVYNDSGYGYITVAHVFKCPNQDSCSIDSEEDDIGIPFDSDSDDEDYCNDQISSIRSKVSTLGKSIGSQASDDRNAFLHRSKRQSTLSGSDSWSNLALLGTIDHREDLQASTDCAIATIGRLDFHQKLESLMISKKEQTIQIASAKPRSSPVTAFTARGPIQGALNNVPILMRFSGQGSFHSVYAFSYEGKIEYGDCGSLVVDSVSKELYGMVFAASDKQRIAYMMSANEFLNSISNRGWRLLKVDEDYTGNMAVPTLPIPPVSPVSGPTNPTLPKLPVGWIAQWDNTYRKYYYVQISTGVSQWEFPTSEAPTGGSSNYSSSPKDISGLDASNRTRDMSDGLIEDRAGGIGGFAMNALWRGGKQSNGGHRGSGGGAGNLVGQLSSGLLGGGKQHGNSSKGQYGNSSGDGSSSGGLAGAASERHTEQTPNDPQPTQTPHITVLGYDQPEWSEEHQRYLITCWNQEYGDYYRTHYVKGKGWEFFDWLPSGSAYPTGSLSTQSLSTQGPVIAGTYDHSMIKNDEQHVEPLDSTYFVRDSSFFAIGRVFSVLFTEPTYHTEASTARDGDSGISMGKCIPSSQIKRFIVVARRHGFCFTVPIFTYGNQATKKRGVVPDEHAIVYSMGNVPQLLTGEKNMSKEPIAVMMADGIPPLSVASRIYFAIHHPVQYNVKAKDLGMVHPEYITRLLNHWGDVSGQQMW